MKRSLTFLLCSISCAIVLPLFATATVVGGDISAESTITSTLDLTKVFQSAPIIYSVLMGLSISSFILWLYSIITLRHSDMIPTDFINQVREQIGDRQFEAALQTCQQDDNFCAPIIASGITHRSHGAKIIMDVIQTEGKRSGSTLWQRISLLQDIAAIAPMLGLLGTVLGMFYAFYNTERTQETIAGIFDGLGMAIGTTVAGLIVAILAMIFYTTLRFRVVRLLNKVENEALAIGSLIAVEVEHTKNR